MTLVVSCQPTSQGAASVAPCYDVDGIPTEPLVVPLGEAMYDFTTSTELFVWAVTLPLLCWVTGLVVGYIVRVIRLV